MNNCPRDLTLCTSSDKSRKSELKSRRCRAVDDCVCRHGCHLLIIFAAPYSMCGTTRSPQHPPESAGRGTVLAMRRAALDPTWPVRERGGQQNSPSPRARRCGDGRPAPWRARVAPRACRDGERATLAPCSGSYVRRTGGPLPRVAWRPSADGSSRPGWESCQW